MVRLFARVLVSFIFRGKRVLFVTGMRRSGNHAFINWFINAFEGNAVNSNRHADEPHFNSTPSGRVIFLNEINTMSGKGYLQMLRRKREYVRNAELIIISAEDCQLAYDKNSFRVPGTNERLIVRRSTLNLVASRLKMLQRKARNGIGAGDMNIDGRFMERLLSLHNADKNRYRIWWYDEWMGWTDTERVKFLQYFGMNNDIPPAISSEGGGSSFTGRAGTPDAVEITQRWKQVHFSDSLKNLLLKKRYEELFTNQEVEHLNE